MRFSCSNLALMYVLHNSEKMSGTQSPSQSAPTNIGFKVGMTVFQLFYEMKLKTSKFWHFEGSKDIMTKFKSQALHIKKIIY